MNGRLVKSDETLLQIVEELARSEQIGVTKLANRLDLTKSTTHRHLQTLATKGYAVNNNGTYQLSHQWFHLGTTVRSQRRFYQAAKSEIRSLAEETGKTVWCAIEEEGRLMFIDGAGSNPTHNPDLLIGHWSPLTNTAAGKAILAHLSKTQITEILKDSSSTVEKQTNIPSPDLLDELEEVQNQGYSVNRGEHISGIYALSMPIIVDERVFGAISVASPSTELLTEDQRYVINLLRSTVEQIERTLSSTS